MKNFLYNINILHSKLSAFLASEKQLHTASFARLHELVTLSGKKLINESLLLGMGKFGKVLQVQSSTHRPELGNVLVVAPTRGGKGLLAVSQLLSWPHSVIVNDIKGELYEQTAGYRQMLGQIYVIDPTGISNCYDPMFSKVKENDLQSAATNLLHRPNEGEGVIFTQRAIVMLTQLFLASQIEQQNYLQYVRKMVQLGLYGAATRLNAINPHLATQFLDIDYQHADFTDKFLVSSWGTLSARMRLLLTEETVNCFSGVDFTARNMMQSDRPVTVYLRWPERDLLSLAPLVRLVWKSLIDELTHTYDAASGQGCKPVLLLVDEAGRTAIPALPEYATTINGRGISLWVAIQSLSQLDAVYGRAYARILRDNMDSQIYYRPCDQETAEYIEKRLGYKSGFAHSESKHSESVSKGLSEQRVPLMTAREIMQMADEEIIGFHRNLPPFKANRMDWRRLPVLTIRSMMKSYKIRERNTIYVFERKRNMSYNETGTKPNLITT